MKRSFFMSFIVVLCLLCCFSVCCAFVARFGRLFVFIGAVNRMLNLKRKIYGDFYNRFLGMYGLRYGLLLPLLQVCRLVRKNVTLKRELCTRHCLLSV